MQPVRNDLDFQYVNQLFRARLHNDSTDSNLTTPFAGLIYYNTATKRVRVYDTGTGFFDLMRPDHNHTVTGAWMFNPSGGAPFSVGNTTLVANLNSQFLNGKTSASTVVTDTLALRTATAQLQASDPVADDDLVTLRYLKAFSSGIRDAKDAVKYATTAHLSATRGGNVLTATGNGALSVDGNTPAVGDRILVKNQTTPSNNGIYVVSVVGSVSAAFVLIRATDADEDAEMTSGVYTWVTNGATQSGSGWLLNTPDPITLNTTGLTFTQVNGSVVITDGAGLLFSGSVLNIGTASTKRIVVNANDIDLYAAYGDGTLTGTSFGNASSIPQITVDAYGRVISATTTTLSVSSAAGILPLGAGGTGADLSATSGKQGGLVYLNNSLAMTITASLSGILQGNGTAAPTAITGTAGYMPRWNGSGPFLSGTSSIYDGGSEVVIGNGSTTEGNLLTLHKDQTAPTLQVLRNDTTTGTASVASRWVTSSYAGRIRLNQVGGSAGTSNENGYFSLIADSTSLGLILGADNASGAIRFFPGGAATERATMLNNGKLGLGTKLPNDRLTLGGSQNFAMELVSPILSSLSLTDGSPGLTSATYYYKIVSLDAVGNLSGVSNEMSITTGVLGGSTDGVLLSYNVNGPGVFGVRIYRGTSSGAQNTYYTTTNLTSFTDNGAAGTAGVPPSGAVAGYVNLISSNGVSWISAGSLGIGCSPTTFTLQTAGHIGPNVTASYDLGSASVSWRTLYAGSLVASSTIISGLTGVVYGNGASALTASVGTANNLPRWSGTAPYLVDSLVSSTATGVGVNFASPQGILEVMPADVAGSSFRNYAIFRTSSTFTNRGGILVTNYNAGADSDDHCYKITSTSNSTTGGIFRIGVVKNSNLESFANNGAEMAIEYAGHVGFLTGNTSGTKFTIGGLGSAGVAGFVSISPGSRSGAPGGTAWFGVEGGTFTNTSTVASGTAPNQLFTTFVAPTMTAANASVTTPLAATVHITGAPIAGLNQTITNSYSLLVAGTSRLDGNVGMGGCVTAFTPLQVGDGTGVLTWGGTPYGAGTPQISTNKATGESSIACGVTDGVNVPRIKMFVDTAYSKGGIRLLDANDAYALVIATSNLEVMRMLPNGKTLWGASTVITTPFAWFEAHGTSLNATVPQFGASGFSIPGSFVGRTANGSPSSPTAVLINSGLAVLSGFGRGATAYGSTPAGSLGFYAAQNFTDSAQGAYFTLSLNAIGALSATERMRITSEGAVSFSSAFGSAGQVLQSNGASAPPTWVAVGTLSGGNADLLDGIDSVGFFILNGQAGGQVATGGTGAADMLTLKATSGIGNSSSMIKFLVGTNGSTEAMRILNTGAIGLHTTAPTATTHIAGDVYAPGFFRGGGEVDGIISYFGQKAENLLANWDTHQGGAVSVVFTGGAAFNSNKPVIAASYAPDTTMGGLGTWNAATAVDTTVGGTMTVTFTGGALPVPANTIYTWYITSRVAMGASSITNVKVEYQKADTTYVTVYNGAPTWMAGCHFRVNNAALSSGDYPLKGARYTLTFGTVGTLFFTEFGVAHPNMITGSFTFATLNKSNYFNQPTRFALGSAAAPSITVFGDTNTGFYFDGADRINITTAGTLRAYIDATGNVNVASLTASKAVFTDASKNLTSTGSIGVDQGGTGTTTAFTAGSVLFAGASGVYSQDNANFFWNSTAKTLTLTGGIGIGLTPTAYLHIKAGTATAGTAPIKLTSGTLLTTAETGALEYDGLNVWFSYLRNSSVRRRAFSYTFAADFGDGVASSFDIPHNLGTLDVVVQVVDKATGATELWDTIRLTVDTVRITGNPLSIVSLNSKRVVVTGAKGS